MYALVGLEMTQQIAYYLFNYDSNNVELVTRKNALALCKNNEIVNARMLSCDVGITPTEAELKDIPYYINGQCPNKALTLLGLYNDNEVMLCDSAFNVYRKTLREVTDWWKKYRCWNKSIVDKNVVDFGLYRPETSEIKEVRKYCLERMNGLSARYNVLKSDSNEDVASNNAMSVNGVYKVYLKVKEEHPNIAIALTSDFKAFVGTHDVNVGLTEYLNRKNAVAVNMKGMKVLGTGAFSHSDVKEIVCNMEFIADKAFIGAEKLKRVVFEDGVSGLGNSIFEGCTLDYLRLPKTLKGVKVPKIFTGCLGVKVIEIPKVASWRKDFDKTIGSLNMKMNIVEY